MKRDSLAKAYHGLTSAELADLSFKYVCDANELELTRLADAVPIVLKRGPHPDFKERYDSLFNAASWWAVERWKTEARLNASFGVYVATDDQALATKSRERCEAWESYLLALDIVLDDVGPVHGLDPEAVRKLAGCGRFEPMIIDEPQPRHVELYKETLRKVLG